MIGKKDLIARIDSILDLAQYATREVLKVTEAVEQVGQFALTIHRDLIVLAGRVSVLEDRLMGQPEEAIRAVIYDEMVTPPRTGPYDAIITWDDAHTVPNVDLEAAVRGHVVGHLGRFIDSHALTESDYLGNRT